MPKKRTKKVSNKGKNRKKNEEDVYNDLYDELDNNSDIEIPVDKSVEEYSSDDENDYSYIEDEEYKSESDNDDLDVSFEDDDIIIESKTAPNIVPKEKKITKPFLSKYERTRLLGTRTQQLVSNAKPMIKNVQNMDPSKIALLEIKHGVLPLIVERTLPNGDKERWYINEFQNLDKD